MSDAPACGSGRRGSEACSEPRAGRRSGCAAAPWRSPSRGRRRRGRAGLEDRSITVAAEEMSTRGHSLATLLRDAVGPAGPVAPSRPDRAHRPGGALGAPRPVAAVESLAATRAGRSRRAGRPRGAGPLQRELRAAVRRFARPSARFAVARPPAAARLAVGPPMAGLTVPASSTTSAMPRRTVRGRIRRPVAIRAKTSSESWSTSSVVEEVRPRSSSAPEAPAKRTYTCPVRPT